MSLNRATVYKLKGFPHWSHQCISVSIANNQLPTFLAVGADVLASMACNANGRA